MHRICSYDGPERRRNADSSDVFGRLNVRSVNAAAGGGLVTAAAAATTRARPVVAAVAAHRNGYAPTAAVVRSPCPGRPSRGGGHDGVPSIRRLPCARTRSPLALRFIIIVVLASTRTHSFAVVTAATPSITRLPGPAIGSFLPSKPFSVQRLSAAEKYNLRERRRVFVRSSRLYGTRVRLRATITVTDVRVRKTMIAVGD